MIVALPGFFSYLFIFYEAICFRFWCYSVFVFSPFSIAIVIAMGSYVRLSKTVQQLHDENGV